MEDRAPAETPGSQQEMSPAPKVVPEGYKPAGKLAGKKALITGGDSGIGRSVAVMFAMEGADVAINYLSEDEDAQETKRLVEQYGRSCHLFPGDVTDEAFCKKTVDEAAAKLGGLNVLVNNAAEQHPREDIREITGEQLRRTFETNIFGYFHMAKHALEHLHAGDSIINTSSVTAYKGKAVLLDYASTKGAITAFTRSLAEGLKDKKIRVNAVAPGPVWTPLITSTFPPEKIETFGTNTIEKRPADPGDIAATYVFLASDDALFYSGQTFHPNGGTVVAS